MAASEGIPMAFARVQGQGRDGDADILATLHALDGRFVYNLGYRYGGATLPANVRAGT